MAAFGISQLDINFPGREAFQLPEPPAAETVEEKANRRKDLSIQFHGPNQSRSTL